ncbi:MAG: GH25 family lysozyme [Propionicimonas sp.]
MTAASKRPSKFLAATGIVVALAVGGLTAPGADGAMPAAVTVVGAGSGSGLTVTRSGLIGRTNPRILAPSSASRVAAKKTTITSDVTDATIGRYGTRTSATFRVKAEGSALRYTWQHRSPSGGSWKTISGAKSARYDAKASAWPSGTWFRVIVTGTGGRAVSGAAKLRVLFPTNTPAGDAEAAFGLSGVTQGVDLSAYQHTPSGRVNLKAVAAWAGPDGFTILRAGSGARPIKQPYTDVCTDQAASTGGKPVVEDCAYRVLADAVQASGLSLGHYWFNGWISSIDTTKRELFAGGYTPKASATQFVTWLTTDGNYSRASTDPLVLDVEAGRAWTKTYQGKTYELTLRAWNPSEAAEFLTTVKESLTRDGYQANLYVYLNANAAARQSNGAYVWAGVAGTARLWVAYWGTNNGRIPDTMPSVGPWAYHGGWSIWQYTSNARPPGDGVGAIDGDIAQADAWTPR